MTSEQLFWLHIKKSAGFTTRKLLEPSYRLVDRSKQPKNFTQATPEEYNDILNNYRVVLGEYQFKRALFAKTYLFPDRWEQLYSFAFVREPTDRCISMFFYLYWKTNGGLLHRSARMLSQSLSTKKLHLNVSYAFDAFLDLAEQTGRTGSIYEPVGIQFTTHTTNMWDDVTDDQGNVLLTRVFRLEDLSEGIRRARDACGLPAQKIDDSAVLNRNENRRAFTPKPAQARKLQQIYSRDFELYEQSALD